MSPQDMEQIIHEYGDDIYRFCFHLTGSRDEADDLYQDTFVKAIQLRHKLDRGGNIKSYLMGISANLWKNRVKKETRRRELIPEISYEDAQWQAGVQSDPLRDVVDQEAGQDVMAAVAGLPDKQRVVVLLHYTQDYPTGEIARILHIPRGTVLSRLAKARQNIRSSLEGRGEKCLSPGNQAG